MLLSLDHEKLIAATMSASHARLTFEEWKFIGSQ